jgi:transposase
LTITDRRQEEEMLEVEQWAEIRRLHKVEKLSARAIARRLGLARNTVNAALHDKEPPEYRRAPRPSCLDPFHDRIAELLADFPELSAVRISEIIEPEGYSGGLSTLRTYLRTVRPKPVQAFQRTEYRPGEIGQLDWASMPDRIPSPTGEPRPVWALILTLGYSRLLDIVFSFGTKLPDFLRAHAQLLAFIGGVPHTLVYDNMGSVVVSHHGKEVIFNPEFLVFAERYGFKPHACTPREPHEKGLVERPVGYIKGNFWAARHFTSLEDLQAQADTWRDEKANVRDHSTLHERPVDRFEREKSALLPLPSDLWIPPDVRFAKVTSQGLIHVDGNQYSVPALLARQQVSVHLSATSVVIYHQQQIVATHHRCWGRHRLFEQPDHLARPWSVQGASAPDHCSGGLQLPAKACVRVAVPDLSRYDLLSQEASDER